MTFKTQKKQANFKQVSAQYIFFKAPNTNMKTKQAYSDTLTNKTISKYVKIYFRNSRRNFARN